MKNALKNLQAFQELKDTLAQAYGAFLVCTGKDKEYYRNMCLWLDAKQNFFVEEAKALFILDTGIETVKPRAITDKSVAPSAA